MSTGTIAEWRTRMARVAAAEQRRAGQSEPWVDAPRDRTAATIVEWRARMAALIDEDQRRAQQRVQWVARLDARDLERLRRRCQSGAADRDFKILEVMQQRARREELARQVATIRAARGDRQDSSVIDRAARYLERCEGGESGEGRNPKAWSVVVRVTRGFALSEHEALTLLAREYSPRCRPALPAQELKGMVRRAVRAARPPWGYLLQKSH